MTSRRVLTSRALLSVLGGRVRAQAAVLLGAPAVLLSEAGTVLARRRASSEMPSPVDERSVRDDPEKSLARIWIAPGCFWFPMLRELRIQLFAACEGQTRVPSPSRPMLRVEPPPAAPFRARLKTAATMTWIRRRAPLGRRRCRFR